MALLPINISSYDAFRNDALNRAAQGLGYDVDGAFGYQCWDLAAELWMNIPEFAGQGLYPQTGPNYAASECWTVSKDINAGNSFDLITNYYDLRRGDCIVIGPSAVSSTGHIAFIDEPPGHSSSAILLGQNQVDPNFQTGHIPTLTGLPIYDYFLGAFRYKEWGGGPGPSPHPITRRDHFPWVLIQRRLREM